MGQCLLGCVVGSHLACTGEGAVACEELEQASGAFTRVEAALPNEHRIWRGGARRTTIGTRAQVCQSNEAMKLLVLGTRNRIVLPTRTAVTASHGRASRGDRRVLAEACRDNRQPATADESESSFKPVRSTGRVPDDWCRKMAWLRIAPLEYSEYPFNFVLGFR